MGRGGRRVPPLVPLILPWLVLGGCDGDRSTHDQDAAPSVVLLSTPLPPGPGGGESADPSLAVDPVTGDLVMAWGATDGEGEDPAWSLYVARSSDGGETFTEPTRVNDRPGDLYPHAEGAPRLVAGPGVLAVFWNNRMVVEGRRFAASDLRFARSTDGGLTWGAARNLQDPLALPTLPPRANTFHGASWVGDSTLVVAWLDGRERDERRVQRGTDGGISALDAARTPETHADDDDPHDGDATVYAAVSHDGGATWEPENRRLQGSICPCCRVTLAATPEGELLGTWRQHFEGSVRDPVVMRVYPVAESDSNLRIHEDGWVFPGCPHSGPSLDVAPDGRVHAAWYSGAEGRMGVHYASRNPGEPSFQLPLPLVTGEAVGVAHPALVARPDGGALVAHNVDAEGTRRILLSGVDARGSLSFQLAIPDSEGGTHPQLALLPDQRVVVAWTESRGGVQRLRLARLAKLEEP